MTDYLGAGFGEQGRGRQKRTDAVDRRSDGRPGLTTGPWPRAGCYKKEPVPQPLRASLSLRNNEFWNHDSLFQSETGEVEASHPKQ
jgi:hypothetical protein